MVKTKRLLALVLSCTLLTVTGCAKPAGGDVNAPKEGADTSASQQAQPDGAATGEKGNDGAGGDANASEENAGAADVRENDGTDPWVGDARKDAADAANSQKTAEEDKYEYEYEDREFPVFRDEMTDAMITLRFYKDTPHVAYIGIKQYYDLNMEYSLDEEKPVMTVKKDGDDTYSFSNRYGKATMDTEVDVLSSDDLEGFLNLMSISQAGIGDTYLDNIGYVRVKEVKTEGSSAMAFDFGSYDIDVIGEEEDVYFPLATLSDIFTDSAYHLATFNGETFYIQGANMVEDMKEVDPDYMKPIMAGLKDGLFRADDLAEYTYNEMCFALDHFYGYPGRAIINDELREVGLEAALMNYGEAGERTLEFLRSTNMAEFIFGCKKLGGFIADGGHSSLDYINPGDDVTAAVSKELASLEQDEELADIYSNMIYEVAKTNSFIFQYPDYYSGIDELKSQAYNGEKYIKKGDTAVYVLDTFMGFDQDKWKAYYDGDGERPDASSDDVVAIVEALEDADKDSAIKNFVFDISTNPGGSVDEVIILYGLVTGNREVSLTYDNTLTGQKVTTIYETDLNLDKKFDEADNRTPYDLNFGVITSSISFSCGNIFPVIMKDGGYPVLGAQSGGGACTILVPTTGEGFSYRISSYNGRYVNKEGKGMDSGVPVDVDLVPKRSDGTDEIITLHDVKMDDEGNTMDLRVPNYSDFYNLDRISEEMNKLYANAG